MSFIFCVEASLFLSLIQELTITIKAKLSIEYIPDIMQKFVVCRVLPLNSDEYELFKPFKNLCPVLNVSGS